MYKYFKQSFSADKQQHNNTKIFPYTSKRNDSVYFLTNKSIIIIFFLNCYNFYFVEENYVKQRYIHT